MKASVGNGIVCGLAVGLVLFCAPAVRAQDWDCKTNGIPDREEGVLDLDGNGIPDSCDPDCQGNSIPDHFEFLTGLATDCNGNNVPDDCEDCNGNGLADACELSAGTSADFNDNGVPDDCDADCNRNDVPDDLEIAQGHVADLDHDGIPDSCNVCAVARLVIRLLRRNKAGILQIRAIVRNLPPGHRVTLELDGNADKRKVGWANENGVASATWLNPRPGYHTVTIVDPPCDPPLSRTREIVDNR